MGSISGAIIPASESQKVSFMYWSVKESPVSVFTLTARGEAGIFRSKEITVTTMTPPPPCFTRDVSAQAVVQI